MTCQILITREEDWYIATDIVSGVASQGKSLDSAMDNLREALELYYEDVSEFPETSSVFLTTLEVAAHAV